MLAQLVTRLADRLHILACETDEPLYVYDSEVIRSRCAHFTSLPWPASSIHFATMANACPAFLSLIRDAGVQVFVNSPGHLEAVRAVGFSGEEIVFASSAMGDSTLRMVKESGALLNLDSLGQLDRWRGLFPASPVGIRCNIGALVQPRASRAGYFLGRDSRLGLTLPELAGLRGDPLIRGLHLYLGTDILDLGYFQDCYQVLAKLAADFPALDYLDFGGGFGLPDADGRAFDFAGYGEFVRELMDSTSRRMGRPLRLILEPGRILAAEAGIFVCRVVDVKEREGSQLVGVNASSAQFPRPLFYPDEARHPAQLLTEREAGPVRPSSVFGCSTYSRDFLARDILLPPARPGDLLILGEAGAYCASARTDFLGFPPAREVFV